ncbi:ABC transporter ATP-binding protein [Defluviitalea phaphyphila]|uniref:ABC transporter ATP-binding protein n=1 Tax=Defluviitalea phaphyphila TaxID=1473580 RepID=UPI0007311160|nr:sn-glycerol-3-phosphate ABC transporter ATP-binding protein UgpC [Defluviitalea phaphyphila]
MKILELKNINKIYPGGFQAVYDCNISIENGEFIVLVGPSGCGKSTLLRMIAGLEEISSGEMLFKGKLINDIAPSDRNIAMVFQNYALYGNMTVYENIGFSLTVRHENSDIIHEKVMKTADIVDLKDYLNRFPKNLSGGQRQRVALGRSIVKDSDILLMDEPLSNLDAKLRTRTRREIVQLHRKLNKTIIYVTHDQVEAMTMADRIVVLNNGHIQQIGTPQELYLTPENIFVGGFIGSPPMSFIEGEIKGNRFIAKGMDLEMPNDRMSALKQYDNKKVIVGIRPEHFYIPLENDSNSNILECKIDVREFLGADTLLYFYVGDNRLIAKIETKTHTIDNMEKIKLAIKMDEIHFFDIETEKRIR